MAVVLYGVEQVAVVSSESHCVTFTEGVSISPVRVRETLTDGATEQKQMAVEVFKPMSQQGVEDREWLNAMAAHPSHRARYNPMRLLDALCSLSRSNEHFLALSMG
ncbi:MAG: hypothetical protein DRR16_14155 [Candidatus Parabeggiatoa sp. nov. 3]|nr:MAG: hypothetical protein DRR00_27935 [Gammaproteobacteria bacterium]RKZ57812.1 MAG: hypothetical protein DRQ99_26395 [Gammaproteobacteria bacterium]RKZ84668.1 MAG: hypothetical protein DRR16_14155 [Gammaproteobacteria bacterium]